MAIRFVYSPRYNLDLGDHVFPGVKFGLIHDKLIADGVIGADEVVAPEPARDEDVALVHEREWMERLRQGLLTREELKRLELPFAGAAAARMADALWMAVGGSILAVHLALEHGFGFNLGGGFHHAFAGHGEGFCALNDVAVAIRSAQRGGLIERAAVVDVDVHHGNGTAAIFDNDPSVYTFSIHQRNNYPAEKPPSDLDVHLEDGVEGAEYLSRLDEALDKVFADGRPELLFYVAGADPYREDLLGGLSLTKEDLRKRDRLVFERAERAGAAVAAALAGGYAEKVEDTVEIQATTGRVAKEVFG